MSWHSASYNTKPAECCYIVQHQHVLTFCKPGVVHVATFCKLGVWHVLTFCKLGVVLCSNILQARCCTCVNILQAWLVHLFVGLIGDGGSFQCNSNQDQLPSPSRGDGSWSWWVTHPTTISHYDQDPLPWGRWELVIMGNGSRVGPWVVSSVTLTKTNCHLLQGEMAVGLGGWPTLPLNLPSRSRGTEPVFNFGQNFSNASAVPGLILSEYLMSRNSSCPKCCMIVTKSYLVNWSLLVSPRWVSCEARVGTYIMNSSAGKSKQSRWSLVHDRWGHDLPICREYSSHEYIVDIHDGNTTTGCLRL